MFLLSYIEIDSTKYSPISLIFQKIQNFSIKSDLNIILFSPVPKMMSRVSLGLGVSTSASSWFKIRILIFSFQADVQLMNKI